MTVATNPPYDGVVSGTVQTRLKITAWNEVLLETFDDASRLSRADVELGEGTDALSSGVFHSIMFYRADATSTYSTVMRLEATLDGRSGSFTVIGDGAYDGTTAIGRFRSIAGSGSGQLAGIECDVESIATHADYPYMPMSITYRLM